MPDQVGPVVLPGQTSLVDDPGVVGELVGAHEHEAMRWAGTLGGQTRRSYQRAAIDALTVGDGILTMDAVVRYRDQIAHQAPTTVRARLAAVRSLAKWLREHDLLDVDELREIERIHSPKWRGGETAPPAPPDPVIDRLDAAAARRLEDQPLRASTARALVALLAGCGLRAAEARHVQVRDLHESRPSTAARQRRAGRPNPPAMTLHVHRAVKRGSTRKVPVPLLAARVLEDHLALLADRLGPLPPDAPVIPTLPAGTGEPVTPTLPLRAMSAATPARMLARLSKDAGLPRSVTPHALRHAYAHRLLEAGNSLQVVQKRLGHTDPATTLRYLRGAEIEAPDPWDAAHRPRTRTAT